MSRKTSLAVTEAASLAGRAIARLEEAAAKIHATETERRDRSLQLVSQSGQLNIVIRQGKTLVQIQGDDFAVSTGE